MYLSKKISKVEDIDSRIDSLRSLLHSAIRRGGDMPLSQNPEVLALSHALDKLIDQAQSAERDDS